MEGFEELSFVKGKSRHHEISCHSATADLIYAMRLPCESPG